MSKGRGIESKAVSKPRKSIKGGKKEKLPAKAFFTVIDAEQQPRDVESAESDQDFEHSKVVKKKISLDDDDEEEGMEHLVEGNGVKWGELEDDSEGVFNTTDDEEEDDDMGSDDGFAPSDEPSDKLMVNAQEDDQGGQMTMKGLREKIQEILIMLEKKQYPLGKSRSDIMSDFKETLRQYYDYSEYMLDLLFHLFRPAEFVDFLEANETPRPVTIRCNTLKTKRKELAAALIARGVNVEPLDKWTAIGLQVFEGGTKVPIGATPEYLAGHYMLQAAASLLPVMALSVSDGQRCLDMCAAPGGKTTHIAAMMRNTGFLAVNDVSQERMTSLLANMHRMGVQNAVVSCMDGRRLPGYYGQSTFDRILLDAPCSGTGVISKDPGVKGKTDADFLQLGQLQRELILAAIDMCAVNGVVVYSTCSVTVEENEQVVEYALKKRQVRLVETGLSFGTPGFTAFRGAQFDKSMVKTRRYYPHTHNLDGFFVAKLERFA